jgi:hypothetical protein
MAHERAADYTVIRADPGRIVLVRFDLERVRLLAAPQQRADRAGVGASIARGDVASSRLPPRPAQPRGKGHGQRRPPSDRRERQLRESRQPRGPRPREFQLQRTNGQGPGGHPSPRKRLAFLAERLQVTRSPAASIAGRGPGPDGVVLSVARAGRPALPSGRGQGEGRTGKTFFVACEIGHTHLRPNHEKVATLVEPKETTMSTRLSLKTLTPEDRRTRKQWARWVCGTYIVAAVVLFCAAYTVPSSDERNMATQFPASQVAELH